MRFQPARMAFQLTLLLSTLVLTAHAQNLVLKGLSHIGITTADLDSATKFYTQVLGGKEIVEFQVRNLKGNIHYFAMFQKEILDAQKAGKSPSEFGVPDISDSGSYGINWNFILFDNVLLQLIQYRRNNNPNEIFTATEPLTSPAIINNCHACFWAQNSNNFNAYIDETEKKASSLKFDKVKFNRPVRVNSEEEREKVPFDQLGITQRDGDLKGFSFGYFKGPTGEQLELVQTADQSHSVFGREFCNKKAVSSAFLQNYTDNENKKDIPAKLWGLHHFGVRTSDLARSVQFYQGVLNGALMKKPLEGVDIRGDETYNMVFQKELLEAQQLGKSPHELHVPDISVEGAANVNYRFVLFDNIAVELLSYSDQGKVYDPRFNWTSPAYVNSMYAGFTVGMEQTLYTFIINFEKKAAANGFTNVFANRAVKVDTLGQTISQTGNYYVSMVGKMNGYMYTYVKGPSGEQLVVSQFTGDVAKTLEMYMLQYGSVSSRFAKTDPIQTGAYGSYCTSTPSPTSGQAATHRSFASLFVLAFILLRMS